VRAAAQARARKTRARLEALAGGDGEHGAIAEIENKGSKFRKYKKVVPAKKYRPKD
jgi:hypothetical protein